MPGGEMLAGLALSGGDIVYVLTGDCGVESPRALTPDEQELLSLYRSAPLAGKAAAIGALQGVSTTTKFSQNFHGKVGQPISVNKLNQKGISFFSGKSKK